VVVVMMACGMVDGQTASPPSHPGNTTVLPTSAVPSSMEIPPPSTEMTDPTEDNGTVLLIAPYARESDMTKALGNSKGAFAVGF
jgi:hypothetical protein